MAGIPFKYPFVNMEFGLKIPLSDTVHTLTFKFIRGILKECLNL